MVQVRLGRPAQFTKYLGLFGFGLLFGACSLNSAKNHYILAEKLWTDGKYAASVSEFEKVSQKDPRGSLGIQALYRAATTEAYFLSRFNDAVKKFKLFAEATTDLALAWEAQKQIGELLYAKMDLHDQTIEHYRDLLKANPQVDEAAEFTYRIAKSQFYLWQFDDATKTYQELIAKYPKAPQAERALYEIGVTYFTQGEQQPNKKVRGPEIYQEAIDSFEIFLKKYPQSTLAALARFGIASCLEELDQLDAAFHAYEALKKTYPSPRVIEIKLARIRERKAQRSR
ncbi:MAG: tetratricopeptide repeat protein [Bdellovibrionota bacterium]